MKHVGRGSWALSPLGLALLVLALPASADAQLLGRASSAARDDDSSSSSSSRDDSSSYDSSDDSSDYQGQYDDDDDDDGGSYLARASDAARSRRSERRTYGDEGGLVGGASYVVRGEPAGPGYADDSSYVPDPPNGSVPYARQPATEHYVLGVHPYAGGASGFGGYTSRSDLGRVASRVELELGYALGGAGRVGASARLQLPFLIDITTRYSVFVEPLDEGVAMLALGRIGAELRIVDCPVLQLRVGAAVRHFHDAAGGLVGGDVGVAFDIFPGAPVILSGEVTVGAVGQAIIVQARGSVGVIIDSTEIYAGYDFEGLVSADQLVDLGGPMLGVRLWL